MNLIYIRNFAKVVVITALFFFFISGLNKATAQTTISGVINKYTRVTAITGSGCSPYSLAVSSITGFNVGDTVMIIEMKGAQIDLRDTSTFGTVINYNNAGNYELNTIYLIQGNVVYLTNGLTNTYDTAGVVQMVRVPTYINAAVSGTLTAKPWNGSTGGVLAFEVKDTLTLYANSRISTNGQGFRGGSVSLDNSANNQYDSLFGYVYAYGTQAGNKGEGFAVLPKGYEAGRGQDANGGGGGNSNGGGGAGGGNYGRGGGGGGQLAFIHSYNGGVAGDSVPYSTFQQGNISKVFLGGGGGGAYQDNIGGSSGGAGGGLIMIKANTLIGNGDTISSIGNPGPHSSTINGQPDAAGGGGAGGTILLDVQHYSSSNALTINVSGGNGGTTNSYDGSGGGGAGGFVWISGSASLPVSVTVNLSGGIHGDNPTILHPPIPNGNYDPGLSNGLPGGVLTGFVLQVSTNVVGGAASGGGTVAAVRDTVCQGTAANLSLSGNPSGAIQWQSSVNDSGFTDINSANRVNYNTNPLQQATWYRATIGSGNCGSVSDTLEIYVPPILTASFYSTQTGAKQLSFNSDSSLGNISSYHWDFGDGQTSNQQNPMHTYTKDSTYYVCLTLYDGSNCSYTYCRYSTVLADAIPVISSSGNWIIYPNPFNDQLTVSSKQANSQLQSIDIYDVLGRLVVSRNSEAINNNLQLDVTALAKGMYYLVIRTADADYIQKVVKQ